MKKSSLKLSGRSGCKIELLDTGNKTVVRKYASTTDYNARLLKQVNKQELFNTLYQRDHFCSPGISQIHPGSNADLAWFEMDYIHADKYSDYLERISVDDLRLLIQRILDYFTYFLSVATVEKPDSNIFLAKLKEVSKKIDGLKGIDTGLVKSVSAILSRPPREVIYAGFCHGDFTFSNILFSEKQVILIDFLDTFYESPIQDIVKLRQDTCFEWTLLIDEQLSQARIYKMKQIFEYVDGAVERLIQTDKILKNWYFYFQLFSLFRIVPYVHRPNELDFVQTSLQKLIK